MYKFTRKINNIQYNKNKLKKIGVIHMNLNILFWNTRDKIILNEGGNKIFNVLDSKEESFYFILNGEKIKATFTECSSNELINKHLKGLCKKSEYKVIILKEINEDNISNICEISKLNNILIIAGVCNFEKKDDFRNVVYVPQLYYETNPIDIYSFLYTVKDIYEEYMGNHNSKVTSIILGCEKEEGILGNIPLYILKHFNYVSKCDNFLLNIYGVKELGMGELIYIEDPLKEYMSYNSKLTIEQICSCINDNKIFFSLIAR